MALFGWSTIWFAGLGLLLCALVLLLVRPLRRMLLPPPRPPPPPPAELVAATEAMAAAAAAVAASHQTTAYYAGGITYSFGETSSSAQQQRQQQMQQQQQQPRLSASDRRLLERLPTFTIAARGHNIDEADGEDDEEKQQRRQQQQAGESSSSTKKAGSGEQEQEEEEEQTCIICTSALSAEGGRCITLPCAHIQHAECSFPWLLAHGTCPECRTVRKLEEFCLSVVFLTLKKETLFVFLLSHQLNSSSLFNHSLSLYNRTSSRRCGSWTWADGEAGNRTGKRCIKK